MCICDKFYKVTIFNSGFLSNVFYTAMTIVITILCGIQYNYIYIEWTKLNIFKCLAPLQIGNVVLCILNSILGFIIFIPKLECKTMELIYIIFCPITFVFSLLVSVFCFLGAPQGMKSSIISNNCPNLEYKGIFKGMENFDSLFIEVDKAFCSANCTCEIFDKEVFEKYYSNDTFIRYININGEIINKISFDNCPLPLKKSVFENYIKNNISHNNLKFNKEKFMTYFEKIENKFKCSGWCETLYQSENDEQNESDENLNINKKIDKYLFSDINKGRPKTFGCVYKVTKWVNKIIIITGSLILVNLIFNAFCIMMDYAILFDIVFEGSNYPKTISKSINQSNGNDISNKGNIQGVIPGEQKCKQIHSIDAKLPYDKYSKHTGEDK